MGALTGFAHGTAAAKDPHAQGTLRLQENIIEYALLIIPTLYSLSHSCMWLPFCEPSQIELQCETGAKMPCRAMLPEERKDVSLFTSAARQRVAGQVGCSAQQVHALPSSRFLKSSAGPRHQS